MSPRPSPSEAPSIIPGISAIIISDSSSTRSTPRFGMIVVKGYGAILGRAFVKKVNSEDFPALGKPTRPASAIIESSSFKKRVSPFCPGLACFGA